MVFAGKRNLYKACTRSLLSGHRDGAINCLTYQMWIVDTHIPRITLFPLMSFSTFALFHLSMYMLGKTAFIESLLRDFIQGSKMHVMQGVGVV